MGWTTGSFRGPFVSPPRYMLFVDGENVVARGQALSAARGHTLSEGAYFKRDTFLWFAGHEARRYLHAPPLDFGQQRSTRSYYYASAQGGDDVRDAVRRSLWDLGFAPEVVARDKNGRSKGVDIALTKDMLCHAYQDHYDVAFLLTGDGDYLPVVAELRRLGRIVVLAAFSSGLSERLRIACDFFVDLDSYPLPALGARNA